MKIRTYQLKHLLVRNTYGSSTRGKRLEMGFEFLMRMKFFASRYFSSVITAIQYIRVSFGNGIVFLKSVVDILV